VIDNLGRSVDPIPMGIDLNDRVPAPQKRAEWTAQFGHLKPFALFVGRLVYYKGLDVLVDAAAKGPWNVVIVGSGPLEGAIRRKIEEYGIGDRVTIVTGVSDGDLLVWYEQCSFFVFPSIEITEAFGLVQVEAMAVGKPCVNTSLPTGVPFVSLDGETGLTVPPKDADAFSKACTRLWQDETYRNTLGRRAAERARAEFSLDVMMDRYEALYQRVLQRR
jgi:rhamnosyl/mannosyltransferase